MPTRNQLSSGKAVKLSKTRTRYYLVESHDISLQWVPEILVN